MRIFLAPALLVVSGFGQTSGVWRVNAVRSTFMGEGPPKSLVVRIEQHAKGEVFTLDKVEADGRTTSSSTILYLDGKPRDFQDFACSGTQSSRRVDSRTVEILRKCADGGWSRLLRRVSARPPELVIEITEQQAGGRRFERRIVMEKQ